jgi:hypothetical protein
MHASACSPPQRAIALSPSSFVVRALHHRRPDVEPRERVGEPARDRLRAAWRAAERRHRGVDTSANAALARSSR